MPKKIYKELIEYICPKCKKKFGNRKDNYETHLNRKNPCVKITQETINGNNNMSVFLTSQCININIYRYIINNKTSYIIELFY